MLVTRNISLYRCHRTSIRLEPEIWTALEEIAELEGVSKNMLCTRIDQKKGKGTSLTAAVRAYVIAYYRRMATQQRGMFATTETAQTVAGD